MQWEIWVNLYTDGALQSRLSVNEAHSKLQITYQVGLCMCPLTNLKAVCNHSTRRMTEHESDCKLTFRIADKRFWLQNGSFKFCNNWSNYSLINLVDIWRTYSSKKNKLPKSDFWSSYLPSLFSRVALTRYLRWRRVQLTYSDLSTSWSPVWLTLNGCSANTVQSPRKGSHDRITHSSG